MCQLTIIISELIQFVMKIRLLLQQFCRVNEPKTFKHKEININES